MRAVFVTFQKNKSAHSDNGSLRPPTFLQTPVHPSGNISYTSCRQTSAACQSRQPGGPSRVRYLTMSNFCISGWSSDSRWHSAQSNHFRPGGGISLQMHRARQVRCLGKSNSTGIEWRLARSERACLMAR